MDHKVCSDCGATCVGSGINTGYATLRDTGAVICFECCGKRDRATMIETGHSKNLPLYLRTVVQPGGTHGKSEVTNWPGTLRFPVWGLTQGRHNMARTRTDIWFNGPDGRVWHGVQYGNFTQVVHCKRTRERIKASAA